MGYENGNGNSICDYGYCDDEGLGARSVRRGLKRVKRPSLTAKARAVMARVTFNFVDGITMAGTSDPNIGVRISVLKSGRWVPASEIGVPSHFSAASYRDMPLSVPEGTYRFSPTRLCYSGGRFLTSGVGRARQVVVRGNTTTTIVADAC